MCCLVFQAHVYGDEGRAEDEQSHSHQCHAGLIPRRPQNPGGVLVLDEECLKLITSHTNKRPSQRYTRGSLFKDGFIF